MAKSTLWEVFLMYDDSHWESRYFRAKTKKAIEATISRTAEFRKVANFKIENADHEDLPANVYVREVK
jgi:hypothetical protein